MTWLLNPQLLFVLALAVAWPLSLWQASNRGETAGKAFVQQQWDAANITQARETLKLVNAAQDATIELQDKLGTQQGIKNDEINNLKRSHILALKRVSNRPERSANTSSSGLPEVAGNGQVTSGCTGAGLFRSDSAVLIGLARDADELRINLKACYSAYDAAREALK